MERQPIVIAGPIGTFSVDGKTEIVGMSLLDLVTQVNAQVDENTKELYFEFESGGGADRVGESMYNYLISLKPRGIKLIGNQTGLIASTATRPWFAMDERIALDDGNKNFMIHNGWLPPGVVSGNQKNVQEYADMMKVKEDGFRAFYSEHTGITIEGLGPLMDDETGFDADQAVAMKFATSKTKSYNIAAYKMKNVEKIKGLLNDVLIAFGKKQDDVLSLIIELEGDVKVSAPIDDISKLVKGTPIFQVDENGAETQVSVGDETYTAKDGKKFTVVEGVLSEDPTMPAADPVEPEPVKDEATEGIAAAVVQVLELMKEHKPLSKEDIKEAVQAELVEFKKSIKTTYMPPKKASEDKAADSLEWDRAFKANEIASIKKSDPDRYVALFYAKYDKMPNM